MKYLFPTLILLLSACNPLKWIENSELHIISLPPIMLTNVVPIEEAVEAPDPMQFEAPMLNQFVIGLKEKGVIVTSFQDRDIEFDRDIPKKFALEVFNGMILISPMEGSDPMLDNSMLNYSIELMYTISSVDKKKMEVFTNNNFSYSLPKEDIINAKKEGLNSEHLQVLLIKKAVDAINEDLLVFIKSNRKKNRAK